MKHFVIILIVATMAGCGQHCVKVGGEYQGVDGEIEYCFSLDKSKEAGLPAFEGDNGKSIFGFDLDQINGIIDKLKEKGKKIIGLSAPVKKPEQVHPVKELLDMLKEPEAKPEKPKEEGGQK